MKSATNNQQIHEKLETIIRSNGKQQYSVHSPWMTSKQLLQSSNLATPTSESIEFKHFQHFLETETLNLAKEGS